MVERSDPLGCIRVREASPDAAVLVRSRRRPNIPAYAQQVPTTDPRTRLPAALLRRASAAESRAPWARYRARSCARNQIRKFSRGISGTAPPENLWQLQKLPAVRSTRKADRKFFQRKRDISRKRERGWLCPTWRHKSGTARERRPRRVRHGLFAAPTRQPHRRRDRTTRLRTV